MRAGGGKQKGSEYERQVCKQLSLWISGGAREDLFWRSAMSGGRATVGKRKGKDLAAHAGDISATHPHGHVLTDNFYVECKRYADLNFGSFLTKQTGTLAGFWNEAILQAQAHDKIPMLIVRQDRGDTLLIVPCESMLTRGMTGYTYGFNTAAWIARLHRIKADIFEFDEVVKKPFQSPSKYVAPGWNLKEGELSRIIAAPKIATMHTLKPGENVAEAFGKLMSDVEQAKAKSKRYVTRSDAGTRARAQQGDNMLGDEENVRKRIRI